MKFCKKFVLINGYRRHLTDMGHVQLITSIIVSGCYFAAMRQFNPYLEKNILWYGIGLVIYFLSYEVAGVLASRIWHNPWIEHRQGQIHRGAQYAAVAAMCGYFMLMYYSEESLFGSYASEYSRHQIPGVLYFLAILTLAVGIWLYRKKERTTSKPLRLIILVAVVGLQTFLLLAPNSFLIGRWGMHHSHAYLNSIMNALNGAPFDVINTSIYGRYAMFYVLPVQILSQFGMSKLTATLIVIAVCGSISFAAVDFILYKIIRSDTVFTLAVVANAVVSTQVFGLGQYWQMLPHRLLFQALVLLGCYYSIERKKAMPIMWPVCVCSLLWNLEVGLICSGIWVFTDSYLKYISTITTPWKEAGKLVVGAVLKLLGVLIAAYLILNGYNIALGGTWNSISTAVFPLGSDLYKVENLATQWQTVFSAYFLEIVLFMGVVCVNFKDALKKNLTTRTLFIVCTALFGLGLMSYYMNRTAYSNLAITHFQFIIILSCFCDAPFLCANGTESKEENGVSKRWEAITCFGAMAVSIAIACSAIGNTKSAVEDRLTSVWKTEPLEVLSERVLNEVPENTLGLGAGVPELYAYLGWDTGLHTIDWSDMNAPTVEYVYSVLEEENSVFARVDTMETLLCHHQFIPVKLFDECIGRYAYYQKMGYLEEEGKIAPVELIAEAKNFTWEQGENCLQSTIPMTIKGNTFYKVELQLPETFDFYSCWALYVDFYGSEYDNYQQDALNFIDTGTYQYEFCFNSGDIGADTKEIVLRIQYSPRDPEITKAGDIAYVRVDELAFTDAEMVLEN